jgi:hypothetical protein
MSFAISPLALRPASSSLLSEPLKIASGVKALPVATAGSMNVQERDVVLQISDAARVASEVTQKPENFAPVGRNARAVLDADYAKAKAEGTKIIFAKADDGRFPDMSGMTDQEVAAVALDSEGLFSDVESIVAQAELGTRVKNALEPFKHGQDLRAYQLGVQPLYKGISSEVREV